MLRRRFHRLTTAIFVVWSLLFAQLALASYVCPQQADAAAAMAMAGMPCEAMDSNQPVLCHQHAAEPGKVFEAVKLPVLSLPALVQMVELPLVLELQAVLGTVPAAATTEGQPPPDPLFLSTLRLRV